MSGDDNPTWNKMVWKISGIMEESFKLFLLMMVCKSKIISYTDTVGSVQALEMQGAFSHGCVEFQDLLSCPAISLNYTILCISDKL